ncbi:hypothetical protein IWW57_000313 [Coemansia sp. S610]|nr:hypothetical protein IWW57_000313 [Coemansia sp. S610]
MASLSPLQTLPLHAVEKIVDYFSDNVRLDFDDLSDFGGLSNYNTYFKPQVPLLWVCRSFRAVVYLRFCKRYELVFRKGQNGGKAHGYRAPAARCLEQLSGPFHLVAKDVAISLIPTSIYSGEALAALSQVLPDDCSFPSASSLRLVFVAGWDGKDDPPISPGAEANISAFVDWIRRMAPRLKSVKIAGRHRSVDHSEATFNQFNSLITQLFQSVNRISHYCHYGQPHQLLNVDVICGLTYLVCTIGIECKHISRLIRLNAPTLQHVDVYPCGDADLYGIIQGDDGGCIEYPRLRTLQVTLLRSLGVSEQHLFAGAAPFPNLRRLVCLEDNPFGSDLVLFRGNAATLEFLHLGLTRGLAAALIQERIFTPTSHPKLQCVMLIPLARDIQSRCASNSDYLQLMFDMAPGAAVRKISRATFGKSIPRLPSLLDKHEFLQVLAFPAQRLVVWDAFTLIKSLPLLSDLHAKAPKLDPMPEFLAFDDLVGYVHTTYSPMATRFRCWHIDEDKVDYVANSVMPFLLLALACPNFDYVAVFRRLRGLLAEQLWMEINKPIFKMYAPRLRRLLLCEPKRM